MPCTGCWVQGWRREEGVEQGQARLALKHSDSWLGKSFVERRKVVNDSFYPRILETVKPEGSSRSRLKEGLQVFTINTLNGHFLLESLVSLTLPGSESCAPSREQAGDISSSMTNHRSVTCLMGLELWLLSCTHSHLVCAAQGCRAEPCLLACHMLYRRCSHLCPAVGMITSFRATSSVIGVLKVFICQFSGGKMVLLDWFIFAFLWLLKETSAPIPLWISLLVCWHLSFFAYSNKLRSWFFFFS